MNCKPASLIPVLFLMSVSPACSDDGNPFSLKYHDWNKGSQATELYNSSYPEMTATRIPPKITDPYPRDDYNYSMFPQGHPMADTHTVTYVQVLPGSQSFPIGSYLPSNIQWQSFDNYAAYGLPDPQQGQRWLVSGHDVVLISIATSKIISGITLP